MSSDHRSPWDVIKEQLQKKLSAESFENWIRRTKFAGIEGKTLLATAPDRQTAAFLVEEYGRQINAMAVALGLGVDRVEFSAESAGRMPGMPGSRLAPDQEQIEIESPITLNPRFTFDSFVVGACNQFAHAAAQSVAMNPSRSYNPLFIYGGVGMGKTHLMHAIGRALMARGRMRIIYTTSERFTNEVVTGIKHERMPQLRARYRTADVLLIDDIQSLGSKERTQEEFFHTFNELHDAQKQIVISSDCPPKEITGLVERLQSRFEWGLMADIQPPDLETKMAILEKKAEVVRDQTSAGSVYLHRAENEIECARTGRGAGQADRLFLAHGNSHHHRHGAAGTQRPAAKGRTAGLLSTPSRRLWRSGTPSSRPNSRKRAIARRLLCPGRSPCTW